MRVVYPVCGLIGAAVGVISGLLDAEVPNSAGLDVAQAHLECAAWERTAVVLERKLQSCGGKGSGPITAVLRPQVLSGFP